MNHLKRGKAKWYERCISCFSVFCWGLCVFLNPNIPVSIWCCVMERLIVRSRGIESALINACTWWCWKGTWLQNQGVTKNLCQKIQFYLVCCFEHLDSFLWREDRLGKGLWGAQGHANVEPRVGAWPGGKETSLKLLSRAWKWK